MGLDANLAGTEFDPYRARPVSDDRHAPDRLRERPCGQVRPAAELAGETGTVPDELAADQPGGQPPPAHPEADHPFGGPRPPVRATSSPTGPPPLVPAPRAARPPPRL